MHRIHCAGGVLAVLAMSAFLHPAAAAEAAKKSKPAAKPAAAMAPAKPAAPSDEALIASAMKAAPEAVGKGATVVAMDAAGAMRTLRKGDNGFTCMPDNPTTPGPDPMCMDANAMDWVMAWAKHADPPKKTGMMYMLEGGTDASNTDPYAEKPTAENHWIKTGPHVMVVGAADLLANYPAKPDPDTSQPYVMWTGTPYAHLMMPVR
jgi:hypothetical protein